MHREYHPDDFEHRQAHASDHPAEHAPHHTALFAFTALLGLLIAGHLLLPLLGLSTWSRPFGVSLARIAAVLGGVRIVYGALEALAHGRIGADFALAQACLAALFLGEDFVAAEVVFIASVGEVLEAFTADRAFRAIGHLFDRAPRTAIVRRDGTEREIPADQVAIGETVIVPAGAIVAVDGTVCAGRSSVDQSSLTGESLPVDRGPGEIVRAGTLNQFGRLEVQAEQVGTHTTYGQVMRLVRESRQRKAPLERAADRYARWFLPVVQGAAGLTLLAGWILGWPDVWYRVVAVLVVACPCALVLATPAAILASMAWLARHGVIVKGGEVLERLAACDTLAFDKTGTLTTGRPELASLHALNGWTEDDLLALAAAAEAGQGHPLARLVRQAAESRGLPLLDPLESQAEPGAGVISQMPEGSRATTVLVGNARLLTERGIILDDPVQRLLQELDDRAETPLIVAADGTVVGLLGVRDPVRPEAHDIVHDLKHLGFTQIALLTGDREPAARLVAKKTHIKTLVAGSLPAEKAGWIRDRQSEGRRVAMVGDGINDAPALAIADVGIALGGLGADLAAEAGDAVLMGEPLHVLPDLVRLSRKTVSILRQNILGFAFGLNAVAVLAAGLGWLGPVAAAILHQVGSLLVLLNSMRLLRFQGEDHQPATGRVAQLRAAIARLDRGWDLDHLVHALLSRWRLWISAALVALILGWLGQGVVQLEPGEVALVQRLGAWTTTLGPGLHLRWPPPIEHVRRVEPARIRQLALGYRDIPQPDATVPWEAPHDRGARARAGDESLLITGDEQMVELAATLQYRLHPGPKALRQYALAVYEPDRVVASLLERTTREVVARIDLAALLVENRREAEQEVATALQRRFDQVDLGLEVVSITFADVHPPLPIVDAYRDVSRAESDRERRRIEAEAYRDEAITIAKGEAAALQQRALATAITRTAEAARKSAAFQAARIARSPYPRLTDQRDTWRTLATSLKGRPKLLLDPESNTARRHLILSTDRALERLLAPPIDPPPKPGEPTPPAAQPSR